eukprot:CAMPEP_0197258922 /NCGR_PEP_ID=MMETSP1429-20130617/83253_1 /TAXON_ID=49237 /ORGANISM="Chaetoceros  sp., Strain UNC1202" /LENGTH=312 /DNA_ID=CAMNT_0042723113 /DNA_START=793 /DNA_END=1731 /DNA_ORIENTATION=-
MSETPPACGICFIITGALLLIILLPLSFSYVDPWQYGLKQRKSTGKVNTSRIYDAGRYLNGPDFKFFTYKADAHFVQMNELDIFSSGGEESVGLSFQLDVSFTYFIIEEEIPQLHTDLARTYDKVVLSRTVDAIKNSATSVTFVDYFQSREDVEIQFRQAVVDRWNEPPSLHVQLDQFHVGRIRIPQSVADKQLQAKIQVETNDKEKSLQDARVEREKTDVEVNTINLRKEKLLLETRAEADLITANARARSEQIKANAVNIGLKDLLTGVGISTQDETIGMQYIRTLRDRGNLDLTVSYLSDANIVKTISN